MQHEPIRATRSGGRHHALDMLGAGDARHAQVDLREIATRVTRALKASIGCFNSGSGCESQSIAAMFRKASALATVVPASTASSRGKLCVAPWRCLRHEIRLRLGCDDVTPGMIAAIQTHGELLHFHPYFHVLLTCGAFTAQGEFLEVPQLDLERLREALREAVFAPYLAEERIGTEVVENMRTCPLFHRAGDLQGREGRLPGVS